MAKKRKDPVPPLEWAAGAIGLLVALLLLAILGREAVSGKDDLVPILVAEVDRIVDTPAGHVVTVRVRNLSDQTAAAVQVEGKIKVGQEEETSGATIDYVPGRSQATGGIIFSSDPRVSSLKIRVTGFEIP